jgi:hypothetical protein
MGDLSNRFWAVTSYFNPAGYSTKLANYKIFRRMLRAPLVAVELAFGGRFELGPQDADILIQLGDGDVMWQKERLLNIGIGRLPKECDFVAWLDCDILLERPDWPAQAARALTRAPVCQLYRTLRHLGRGVATTDPEAVVASHESIGYAAAAGLSTPVAPSRPGGPSIYPTGHALCARRDFLERYGLYDRNIVGGGNRLLAHGILGQAEEVIANDKMTPAHAEDYRRWISAVKQAATTITYIEGDIYHLWHGDLERRGYVTRKGILAEFGYDPAVDIALSPEGCWKWSSPKAEMHRKVREYFYTRHEDGDGQAPLAVEGA